MLDEHHTGWRATISGWTTDSKWLILRATCLQEESRLPKISAVRCVLLLGHTQCFRWGYAQGTGEWSLEPLGSQVNQPSHPLTADE